MVSKLTENYISKCPCCYTSVLINDSSNGETICSKCGLVIDDNSIDMRPEWRAFNAT